MWLLAHHVVKGDGSPFAIKGLMRHESSLPKKAETQTKKQKTAATPKAAHRFLEDALCP